VPSPPRLEQAEIERTKRKPTANLDAYDYYLRGLAGVHEWTNESTADAIINFRQAIELDPHFAAAYGMAARCYVLRKSGGWMTDHDLPEVARLARRAAELGKDDAVALGTAGLALSFFVGLHEDGKALTDRAISLNPNFAMAWMWSGWVRVWLGETETAVERVRHALRLSPKDHPHSYSMFSALAFAHFFAGRKEEAASWAEMAVREKSNLLITLTIAAASSALAGRLEDAARALAQLRQLHPTLRMENLRKLFPIRRPEDFAKLAEGMRLAGLPE
jgi:tetratricopeptide (TPR) repeat protein